MRITSKENAKVKEAFAAKNGKNEYFLVDGFHLAEEAILGGYAVAVFSLKEYPTDLPHYEVNEAILEKLSSVKNGEGIVTMCRRKESQSPMGSKILFLDRVQDPGNVGTLLRTALAFGYRDVILSRGSASPYGNKALMASQGAIFQLNVHYLEDEGIACLKRLQKEGYSLFATALKDAIPLREAKKADRFVLILGNEGQGISEEILALSDQRIRIEMGNIDSLNVGVAGGILMYLL